MASNHSLIPRGAPSGPQTSPKTLQTTIWESKSSPLHLLCDQQTCGNLMDSLSHGCGHGGGYAAALGITLKLDTQWLLSFLSGVLSFIQIQQLVIWSGLLLETPLFLEGSNDAGYASEKFFLSTEHWQNDAGGKKGECLMPDSYSVQAYLTSPNTFLAGQACCWEGCNSVGVHSLLKNLTSRKLLHAHTACSAFSSSFVYFWGSKIIENHGFRRRRTFTKHYE